MSALTHYKVGSSNEETLGLRLVCVFPQQSVGFGFMALMMLTCMRDLSLDFHIIDDRGRYYGMKTPKPIRKEG